MNYHAFMEFEWDEAKSDACFTERGFDFTYVLQAFIDPDRLVRQDYRWNYGEERYQLLGMIEQRIFSLSIPFDIPSFELFRRERPINAR